LAQGSIYPVRRRDLLRLLTVSGAGVLTGADSVRRAAGEDRFYVSATGDDAADGRSPATAWRSVSAVNARLADGTVAHPATVAFERGATFHGKLRAPQRAPTTRGYLSFGAYGPGSKPRPVISGYVDLSGPSAWRSAGGGNWLADLGAPHRGYDGAQGGRDNIGFLKVDDTIRGRRVWQLTALRGPWDFHCDGHLLHVRASANPGTLARRIEAACDGDAITVGNALWISDLVLTGSGGHGIAGSATDLVVVNNEFSELGGSRLYDTTRYGNGFQAWINSERVTVAGNVFHDIYDVALTAQGDSGSPSGSPSGPAPGGWVDVTFRNNLVHRCNQSIEFWSQGRSGVGFSRVLVERNTCLFAGYGWSSNLRPDRDTRVHLLTYGWDLPADITVRHNTFYDAALAYRYSAVATPGLRCSGNVIAQRDGRVLKVKQPQTTASAASWVAAEGNDQGSRFEAVPTNAPISVPAALADLERWNRTR
jgi:hypothetical protein